MTSQPPPTDVPPTAPPNGTTTTKKPQSVDDLPPAALDLAAKLFDLARAGTTPTLKLYLDAGAPKNLTNAAGDTLLMLAAYHGHADTARMLIAAGADVNVLNGRGQSIIAGAVFKGYEDVVKVLFEAGADVGRGQPNAVDCARMFKREGVLALFGEELGEGREIRMDGQA
ncbi:ankyrin repeat-containing domain protein [Boeremia exigua]|uniref:ankyrin repeat-containing domain protein n=1 Tax=Boeremia exigua TaxID=749465 RepID=UPI001E8DEDA8|nr:ankyrin repeat-containing domain protein [Boeremia exigua]KAH6633500.1 ankyrin repeat-containing domain protein [Boeremia exigua]